MKREIKFKGLRTDGKGWVYGSLAYFFNQKENTMIMPNCYFGSRDFGEEDEDENTVISDEMILGGFLSVFPESVGQFTGLKDLQGNDIFEGDVILSSFKIKQKETKEERLIENKIIVEWKHQEEDYEQSHFYGYDVRDGKDVKYNNVYWDCLEMKYEIVGNIHENPEILNTHP